VYAAENQQMVFLGQVVSAADDGIEPLIAAEKSRRPQISLLFRPAHRIEYGQISSSRGQWRAESSCASAPPRNESG